MLWDLDGTLVDSEPAWFAAESAMVQRFGGTWSTEQALELTGSDLNRTAAVLQSAGVVMEAHELIRALVEAVAEQVLATRPWMPGVREALIECREAGVPCGLVSMSWRPFTTAVAGLLPGAFAVVVSGDDVNRGKPDPEAYLTGAAKLGLRPADCIAIEDSPTGIASALAAGIPTVGVPNPLAGGIMPTPGLTVLRSTEEVTLELLRRVHSESRVPPLRTAGTCPGTSTSRTTAL
ncbi:MAG: HAD family phosphatase [Bifidobacteriaceae bacterium]|nr:HAD family phosphatase [Bifidobacteriaceae bacterium]